MDVRKLSIAHFPFLRILIFYTLGLEIGSWISWTAGLQINFLIVGFFAAVILLILLAFGDKKMLTFCSYLVLIILSMLCSSKNSPIGFNESLEEGQYIAKVVSFPKETKRQIRLEVQLQNFVEGSSVQSINIPALAVFWKNGITDVKFENGDLIQFEGKLTSIQEPFNPLEFNYANYLKGRSIRYQVLGSTDKLQLLSKTSQWSIVNKGQQIQQILVKKLKSYFHEEDVFQVIAAISIGLRTDFSDELLKTFINTGTVHVLSVSGMHVGLFYLVLTFLLKPIDYLLYGRSIRFWFIIVLIWYYATICGFSPAVLRATVMYSLLLYGYWRHHSIISFNLLFASAWILLVLDPDMRFDIGFQLSYLAVLGIMLFVPIFQKICWSKVKWKQIVLNVLYSSIAAQLITSPLTFYYFHQFPIYFLLANLFMTIPSAVILYAGLGILISPFPMLNSLIASWVTKVIQWSTEFLQFLEKLPFSNIQGIEFSRGLMWFSYVVMLALFLSYVFKHKYLFVFAQVLMLVLLRHICQQIFQETQFEGLTFYNVKKDIAISYINRSEVMLFTSFDSLQHQQLRYSVWPHLMKYEKYKFWKEKNIVKLAKGSSGNKLLSIGDSLTLFILNQTSQEIPNVDLLLIRNNSEFETVRNSRMCVLDASNHDQYLHRMCSKLDSIQQPYYVLKDNFAYVWHR